MFAGVSERVIRLCGIDSDVTVVSMGRYGRHILPIMETPEGGGIVSSSRPALSSHLTEEAGVGGGGGGGGVGFGWSPEGQTGLGVSDAYSDYAADADGRGPGGGGGRGGGGGGGGASSSGNSSPSSSSSSSSSSPNAPSSAGSGGAGSGASGNVVPPTSTALVAAGGRGGARLSSSHLDVIRRLSNDGRVPFYWRVAADRYGSPDTWERFSVDESFFIRSTTGRAILCMEADSTNTEDALGLGTHSADLVVEDATQGKLFYLLSCLLSFVSVSLPLSLARRLISSPYTPTGFRRVEVQVRQAGFKHYRVLRVFLGDSLQRRLTGGGNPYTLRDRYKFLGEFDVLIDAKAPVLQALLRWCQRACGGGSGGNAGNGGGDGVEGESDIDGDGMGRSFSGDGYDGSRDIVFHTESREYFLNLKHILAPHGYNIIDPTDVAR